MFEHSEITMDNGVIQINKEKNRGHHASSTDRLNILLVEDVHTDAILTKIALDATKVPYKISICKRGDDALASLRDEKLRDSDNAPDLIMLDLGLPGVDGFEVLSQLAHSRGIIRTIPILILTSHRHFEYIQKSYPLLIMDYINKPCNADDLKDILNRVQNIKASQAFIAS